jgi:hypothetical protein
VRHSSPPFPVFWLPLALLLLAPAWARAGNDDGVLLGNDAVLTGGAITAVVSDGSALWYNPAGLAQARDLDTLDVSASAYGLRSYRMPGLLRGSDGSSADANFTEVLSIPSAVSYVRPVGQRRVTAALGLFTPQSNDYTLRASLSTTGAVDTRWQIGLAGREVQYYAGGGLGIELSRRVLLGVALLGAYQSASGSVQASGSVEDGAGGIYGFGVQSSIEQGTVLGLTATLGLMLRVSSRLSVGASLRSPGMTVFRSVRITAASGTTSLDENGEPVVGFEPLDERTREAHVSMYAPLRARLGVAYALGPGAFVSLDGDVQSALRNDKLDLDRVLTWNLRLGARLPFHEHYAFGAGMFTDRSAERAADNGAGPVNFYGFSMGLQYWSARQLAPSEPQQRLTFSTTVGVRYAHGTGKFEGMLLDAEGGEVSYPAVGVKVDEIALQLGSALHF